MLSEVDRSLVAVGEKCVAMDSDSGVLTVVSAVFVFLRVGSFSLLPSKKQNKKQTNKQTTDKVSSLAACVFGNCFCVPPLFVCPTSCPCTISIVFGNCFCLPPFFVCPRVAPVRFPLYSVTVSVYRLSSSAPRVAPVRFPLYSVTVSVYRLSSSAHGLPLYDFHSACPNQYRSSLFALSQTVPVSALERTLGHFHDGCPLGVD